MEIRPSQPSDVPAIVNLLRLSLGETLMPKSEAYWYWKHFFNPFGKSLVLLAFDKDILVGVRAFMFWQWQISGKTLHAVRAVDTATHPQHQGKGIFKKLTMQLVTQCKSQGISFIFNTPNGKSKPGYIKMGWRDAGKFPVRVSPRGHIVSLRGVFNAGDTLIPAGDNSVDQSLGHVGFESLLKGIADSDQSRIRTLHNLSSLKWRYAEVPVVHYFSQTISYGNELKAVAFYRFKKTSVGIELRVVDVFCDSPVYAKQLQESLLSIADSYRVAYVTISGLEEGMLFRNWFSPLLKVGPDVTIRELNGGHESDLIAFSNWGASIGDFELF